MVSNPPTVQRANDLLAFTDSSPTPFHAVASSIALLENANFVQIKERDLWSSTLKPGGKYYLTRNTSTLIAFAVGEKWHPGNAIAMIGSHTDSCCLRIKPVSKRQSDGFLQVGVEKYGSGLWHTWFDRDLSISGRVVVNEGGKIKQKLIKVERPLCRIPALAPHLAIGEEKFAFNTETQLFPVAGMVAAELNRLQVAVEMKQSASVGQTKDISNELLAPLKSLKERHHPYLVDIIAEEAGVDPLEVQDFEMLLYDTQKSSLGGMNNDYIFAARLDDLMMCYCSVEGLIQSLESPSALKEDSIIRLISLWDHEEIGSLSQQGADSNLLPTVVRRLSTLHLTASSISSHSSPNATEPVANPPLGGTAYEQTLASSFFISADMEHAVNPNYPDKHESEHRPELNKGVVLKINANNSYATNSPGIVLMQEVAKRAKNAGYPSSMKQQEGVPLQMSVVRNDIVCGSTIGPIVAAKLGVRTVDLGNSQLSMHSIRETAGSYDVEHAINLFESYFNNFAELNARIEVD